jgi:hypothetical protein
MLHVREKYKHAEELLERKVKCIYTRPEVWFGFDDHFPAREMAYSIVGASVLPPPAGQNDPM